MSMLSRRNVLLGAAATAAGALAGQSLRAESPPVRIPVPPEAKFQLGLVTYNVAAAWDLTTLLKVCKNASVVAVELRTTHKHGVEPTLTKDQRAEVRKKFADSGVRLWGLGSVCEFHAVDGAVVARHIETCKQFVDLAADLGAQGVKVRPNGLPKEVPVPKTLEQIGKSLITCGKAAADKGVEIWVEVHGPGTSEPAHMKTIMEQCGHPAVGVNWNSNATDVKSGSVAESFGMLRPWLKTCHINDLWKDSTGAYPYRELFRLMRETGYDRYTMNEVGTTFTDAAQGEQFLKHYRALWTTLANG